MHSTNKSASWKNRRHGYKSDIEKHPWKDLVQRRWSFRCSWWPWEAINFAPGKFSPHQVSQSRRHFLTHSAKHAAKHTKSTFLEFNQWLLTYSCLTLLYPVPVANCHLMLHCWSQNKLKPGKCKIECNNLNREFAHWNSLLVTAELLVRTKYLHPISSSLFYNVLLKVFIHVLFLVQWLHQFAEWWWK